MSSLASKQGPRYRHTAGEGEPYETIAVEKLTPIIGAEITGVDLGRLVSDEPVGRISGAQSAISRRKPAGYAFG
jgi:hypothetical protein